MQTAPVSCRAERNVPPAATIAFVTGRLPLPISPNTTSPPRACTVRPASSETSIRRKPLQFSDRSGTLRRRMRLSRGLLALLAILAVAGWWAVPFLLVAGLLLNGWYVGEDRILALRAGRLAPR